MHKIVFTDIITKICLVYNKTSLPKQLNMTYHDEGQM